MLDPHIDELRINAARCYSNDSIRPTLMASAQSALRLPDALQDDDLLPDPKLDLLIWKICQEASGVGQIESPVETTSDSMLRRHFAVWDQSFEVSTSREGEMPLIKRMKFALRKRMQGYLGDGYEIITAIPAQERFYVRSNDIQRAFSVTRQQVLNWTNAAWWPQSSQFGSKTWYSDEVTIAVNSQPKLSKKQTLDWRVVCTPAQLVGWVEEPLDDENDNS